MIKMVYANGVEDKMMGFMQDLVDGKYDALMKKNGCLGSVARDKARIRAKLSEGMTIKEGFAKMFDENMEELKISLGQSDEGLIEQYNDMVASINIEKMTSIIRDVQSKEIADVFSMSLEIAKGITLELR